MTKTRFWFFAPLLFVTSCLVDIGDWEEESMSTYRLSEPAGSEEVIEARIELNVGKLELEAADAATAFELDFSYNQAAFEPDVEFERQGTIGKLDISLKGEGKTARRIGKTRLALKINPDRRLRLVNRSGVGQAEVDLSGMTLESLRFEAGVGESKLSMLTPNRGECTEASIRSGVGSLDVIGLGNFNCSRFEFEGGVGGSVLDFSGEWGENREVTVTVGVGGVEIHLPRDLGARIRTKKTFLSAINLDGFEQEGDVYVSENLDRARQVVEIDLRAGIGGVDVKWM